MSRKSKLKGRMKGIDHWPHSPKRTQGYRKLRRRQKAHQLKRCTVPGSSSKGAAHAMILIAGAFLIGSTLLGVAHAIFFGDTPTP